MCSTPAHCAHQPLPHRGPSRPCDPHAPPTRRPLLLCMHGATARHVHHTPVQAHSPHGEATPLGCSGTLAWHVVQHNACGLPLLLLTSAPCAARHTTQQPGSRGCQASVCIAAMRTLVRARIRGHQHCAANMPWRRHRMVRSTTESNWHVWVGPATCIALPGHAHTRRVDAHHVVAAVAPPAAANKTMLLRAHTSADATLARASPRLGPGHHHSTLTVGSSCSSSARSSAGLRAAASTCSHTSTRGRLVLAAPFVPPVMAAAACVAAPMLTNDCACATSLRDTGDSHAQPSCVCLHCWLGTACGHAVSRQAQLCTRVERSPSRHTSSAATLPATLLQEGEGVLTLT
jgi:hypothetical protein